LESAPVSVERVNKPRAVKLSRPAGTSTYSKRDTGPASNEPDTRPTRSVRRTRPCRSASGKRDRHAGRGADVDRVDLRGGALRLPFPGVARQAADRHLRMALRF